jgi:putative FmdB family regulatory protein
MPIYEYFCIDCRQRVNLFFRTITVAAETEPTCPHCGGKQLRRLVSRVAVLRSEEARLDALADPSTFADLDEEDPREIGRMMRQLSNEMGDEMDDPEFNEVIDRLESGQAPEDIEKAMPDLAGGGSGGMEDLPV